MKFEIGDKFISNNGEGPLKCWIVAIEGDHVQLERTTGGKSPNATHRWWLPKQYLNSNKCGWQKEAGDGKA